MSHPRDRVGARVMYKGAWEAKQWHLPYCKTEATVVDYRDWTEDYWLVFDDGYEYPFKIKEFLEMFVIIGWRK